MAYRCGYRLFTRLKYLKKIRGGYVYVKHFGWTSRISSCVLCIVNTNHYLHVICCYVTLENFNVCNINQPKAL